MVPLTSCHHAVHAHINHPHLQARQAIGAVLRASRRRSSHLLLCAGLAGLALAMPALRIALRWVSATLPSITQVVRTHARCPPRGGRDRAVHLRGYAMATFFPGAGGKFSPASITSGWTAAVNFRAQLRSGNLLRSVHRPCKCNASQQGAYRSTQVCNKCKACSLVCFCALKVPCKSMQGERHIKEEE